VWEGRWWALVGESGRRRTVLLDVVDEGATLAALCEFV
jgi:hypothetical protein